MEDNEKKAKTTNFENFANFLFSTRNYLVKCKFLSKNRLLNFTPQPRVGFQKCFRHMKAHRPTVRRKLFLFTKNTNVHSKFFLQQMLVIHGCPCQHSDPFSEPNCYTVASRHSRHAAIWCRNIGVSLIAKKV